MVAFRDMCSIRDGEISSRRFLSTGVVQATKRRMDRS
jgi:hypothetical protein